MGNQLICPDCGGIVGGDLTDGRRHCQCSTDLSLDDTEVEAAPVVPAAAPPPPVGAGAKKICCQCGKDVTHAKRAKDARGYWCYECHRADLRRERFGDKPRARCPQCGRMVPADTITSYHGDTMCAKCRVEQDELPNHQKLKFKRKLDTDNPEVIAKQKKHTIILLCIFGGLLVLVIAYNLIRLRH